MAGHPRGQEWASCWSSSGAATGSAVWRPEGTTPTAARRSSSPTSSVWWKMATVSSMGVRAGHHGAERAEEALRESEERFRAIVESTRDWIWFADAEGIHRYSNRAVYDLLGYARGGRRPARHAVHASGGQAMAMEHMGQAIAERSGWSSLVIRWRHRDGTYRYLESAAAPAFGPTGELLGWYGADRDITERIQMQAALQRSEARLRALFAAMTDVILVMDVEGRYLEIAPTKPDLLYRPAEELLGRTVHGVFPPEQADFFLDHIRQTLQAGGRRRWSTTCHRRPGAPVRGADLAALVGQRDRGWRATSPCRRSSTSGRWWRSGRAPTWPST